MFCSCCVDDRKLWLRRQCYDVDDVCLSTVTANNWDGIVEWRSVKTMPIRLAVHVTRTVCSCLFATVLIYKT